MLEKPRITLHDVADLAGVSHQTVSRVINKSSNVRPETRDKVEAAILELGYRPNAIARSMVRGITRTLGCITPNFTDPVFTRIIESAQAEARRQGFFLLIGSAATVEEVEPLLNELLNRRVDGLIVLNARDDERYKMLLPLASTGSPIVYVKNSPREERVSSVSCDDIHGGYLATRYLLELGHRQIAIILGLGNEQCTSERLEGYRRALQEVGLSPREDLILQGDWSAPSGSSAITHLLDRSQDFSAVFALNDRMAAGAIQKLREVGYRIPEEISVIGYDNMPLCTLIYPTLTTVEQPLDYFGEQASSILINQILTGDSEPLRICAKPQLIIRESVIPYQVLKHDKPAYR
jgi:LacI family transcriptional regulator